MWKHVLEKFPDAELHIAYGWDLFVKGFKDNPERMEWKQRMEAAMKQKGITDHGRIGKKELKKLRQKCGIWAYPTDFTEINCITALECQNDGLVPVVMNYAALKETVGSGIRIEGDIWDEGPKKEYLESLLSLMNDETRFNVESGKAKEWAKSYSWEKVADEWLKHF